MAEQFTTKLRKRILVRFIETLVLQGVSIEPFITKPLNWFNYEVLIQEINKAEKENGNEPEFTF